MFDPATDLLDEVQLISPTVDTNDGTSLATLTGSTLGNSATLEVKFIGGPFSGTGTTYSRIDALVNDTTPGANLNTYIDGIQEILD